MPTGDEEQNAAITAAATLTSVVSRPNASIVLAIGALALDSSATQP